MTTKHITLRSTTGWRVPPVWRGLVFLFTAPLVGLGVLCIISLFFMIFGVPLVALAGPAFWKVMRSEQARFCHPALPVTVLGLVEAGVGYSVLQSIDPGDQTLGTTMLGLGLVTIALALGVLTFATTIAPPPPPPQAFVPPPPFPAASNQGFNPATIEAGPPPCGRL